MNEGLIPSNLKLEKQRLIEKISIALFFTGLPFFFVFQYINQSFLSYMVAPVILGFAGAFYFNRHGFSDAAAFLIIAWGSISISFFACALGKGAGVQNVLISFLAVSVVMMESKQKTIGFVSIFIPIVGAIILEIFDYSFFQKFAISNSYLTLINLASITTNSVIIFFCIRFYSSERKKVQACLEMSNRELLNANSNLEQINATLTVTLNNLETANALVLSQQATLGAVARGIMHEVMGPISAIKSSCDVVVSESNVPNHAKDIVSQIDRYLDRLTDLIQSMLVHQGKIKRSDAPLDINKSILQVVRLVQNDATRNQIKLTTQLTKISSINGSVAYFSQAILNLLLNAIRYSPAHSEITVKTWQANEAIWITIQDQGPGIAPAIKDRLFQQGATTAGADTPNNHAGLGLFFVKQVIESLRGNVMVMETSEKGTVFGVELLISPNDP